MDNLSGAFVALGTSLFREVVEFYQQFLAQTPQSYSLNRYAEFRLGTLRLGIFCPQGDRASEFANSVGSGLSLCIDVVDLEIAIADLKKSGYCQEITIQITSHGRECHIYDPAGNRLILYQKIHHSSAQ